MWPTLYSCTALASPIAIHSERINTNGPLHPVVGMQGVQGLKEAAQQIEKKLASVADPSNDADTCSEDAPTQDATPHHGNHHHTCAQPDANDDTPEHHKATNVDRPPAGLDAYESGTTAEDERNTQTGHDDGQIHPSDLDVATSKPSDAEVPASDATNTVGDEDEGYTSDALEYKDTISHDEEVSKKALTREGAFEATLQCGGDNVTLVSAPGQNEEKSATARESSILTQSQTEVSAKQTELQSGQPCRDYSIQKTSKSADKNASVDDAVPGGEEQASAIRGVPRTDDNTVSVCSTESPNWDFFDGGCTPPERMVQPEHRGSENAEMYRGWDNGLKEAEDKLGTFDTSDYVAVSALTLSPSEHRNDTDPTGEEKSIRQLKREVHQAECDAAGHHLEPLLDTDPDPRPTYVASKVVLPNATDVSIRGDDGSVNFTTAQENKDDTVTLSLTESVIGADGSMDQAVESKKAEPLNVGPVKPPSNAPMKGMPQPTGIHKHFDQEGGTEATLIPANSNETSNDTNTPSSFSSCSRSCSRRQGGYHAAAWVSEVSRLPQTVQRMNVYVLGVAL